MSQYSTVRALLSRDVGNAFLMLILSWSCVLYTVAHGEVVTQATLSQKARKVLFKKEVKCFDYTYLKRIVGVFVRS